MHLNSRGKHKKYFMGEHSARILASISILALIFVLCLWVPLALASDADADQAEPGETTTSASTAVVVADNSDDGTAADIAGNDGDEGGQADAAQKSAVAEVAPETGGGGDSGVAAVQPQTAVTTSEQAASSQAPQAAVQEQAPQAAVEDQYSGDGEGCCPEPYTKLELYCGERYWAGDTLEERTLNYQLGLLSIDYELKNTGTETAYNVEITRAEANQGVEAFGSSPFLLRWEEIQASLSVFFTIIWHVPDGVTQFQTAIEACADGEPGCDEEPVDPCIEDPNAEGCQPVDPCIEDPNAEGCQPVDPCIEDPNAEGCQPVDPCIEDPNAAGCQYVDPCIEDPNAAGCQYVDPCIEDPTQCDAIDSGGDDPVAADTEDELAPVLTRSVLPSTGYNAWNGIIVLLALMVVGFVVPLAMHIRGREN